MNKLLSHLMALLVLSAIATPKAIAQTQSDDADQNWTGVDPATAAASSSTDEKTVYFYNVGKKMFLGRGGRWGTECVLSEVGQPYTIASTNYTANSTDNGYTFQSSVIDLQSGSSNGYLYGAYTGNSSDCYNYFSDSDNGAIFYFKEVTNTNNQKTYKIYSYLSGQRQTTTTSGTAYYMAGQKNTDSGCTSLASLADIAINAIPSTTSITDNSDVWILVTQKQRHDLFSTNSTSRFCHVPGTFLIQDEDFARKDNKISNWKNESGSSLTNGDASTLSDSYSTTTYYVGNGTKQADDGQASPGSYMAANIAGANGTIKQEITGLYLHGWYEVRCNAFTTSTTGKAVLYAKTGTDVDETKTSSSYCEAKVTQFTGTRPTTYLAAAQEVDNTKYQISVLVYVDKASSTQAEGDETCNPIELGVKISGGEDTDLTTIDNFELVYRGITTDRIILDETNEGNSDYVEKAASTSGTEGRSNLTYMEAQNNVRTQSNMCEVYFQRTLKANQWNSIILPIRLTAADVKGFWGEGTWVSEFKGANDSNNPNCINFENSTDGIYPGKLYLIKPASVPTTTLSEDVTSTNAKKSDNTEITLAKGAANVYKIDAPKYGVDADGNSVEYDKKVITGDSGKETYDGTEGKIQYAGTYFYQKGIVPGNSYYVMNNKWYYSGQGVTNNSKGFRAWIQQASATTSEAAAKSYSFYINGVNATGYETTGIEGISADNTLPAQFNIYNVSGQLVRKNATSLDNLAKGIYIVAGKKYIVK